MSAAVEGELSEIYRRFIFRSDSGGQIACVPSKPQPWTLTFEPQTGLWHRGGVGPGPLLGAVEGTTSEVALAGTVRLKKT